MSRFARPLTIVIKDTDEIAAAFGSSERVEFVMELTMAPCWYTSFLGARERDEDCDEHQGDPHADAWWM